MHYKVQTPNQSYLWERSNLLLSVNVSFLAIHLTPPWLLLFISMEKSIEDLKLETRIYINGQFVEAKSGKKSKIINPSTGEVIVEVEQAG